MSRKAKENNWVNYFVFQYMIQHCRPGGVLSHPAQIGIEVGVPQPKGYEKTSVRRDIVISMKANKLSRQGLAQRMKTGRSQVRRLLDPKDGNVTLATLQRAAKIVGRSLRLELV
jgi:hypothetical protein